MMVEIAIHEMYRILYLLERDEWDNAPLISKLNKAFDDYLAGMGKKQVNGIVVDL